MGKLPLYVALLGLLTGGCGHYSVEGRIIKDRTWKTVEGDFMYSAEVDTSLTGQADVTYHFAGSQEEIEELDRRFNPRDPVKIDPKTFNVEAILKPEQIKRIKQRGIIF